jgi:hypothetical protein
MQTVDWELVYGSLALIGILLFVVWVGAELVQLIMQDRHKWKRPRETAYHAGRIRENVRR